MADEVNNPFDRASQDRLAGILGSLRADLINEVRGGAQLSATETAKAIEQATRAATTRPLGTERQPTVPRGIETGEVRAATERLVTTLRQRMDAQLPMQSIRETLGASLRETEERLRRQTQQALAPIVAQQRGPLTDPRQAAYFQQRFGPQPARAIVPDVPLSQRFDRTSGLALEQQQREANDLRRFLVQQRALASYQQRIAPPPVLQGPPRANEIQAATARLESARAASAAEAELAATTSQLVVARRGTIAAEELLARQETAAATEARALPRRDDARLNRALGLPLDSGGRIVRGAEASGPDLVRSLLPQARPGAGGLVLDPAVIRAAEAEYARIERRIATLTDRETFLPGTSPAALRNAAEMNALLARRRELDPLVGGGGSGGGVPPRPTATPAPDDPGRRSLRDVLPPTTTVVSPDAAPEAERVGRQLENTTQKAARLREEALKAARSTEDLARSHEHLSRATRIAGDDMHRHGLMTTEFISAAIKGQVTARELGVQIGGTIAKFGGWTLAASLTYGAFTALTRVGQGALESAQGVNQLDRVVNNLDKSAAQVSFRQMSNEFNLPMQEVTASAYEASKAFKDQADALLATKAALSIVKIGELDAAEGGRVVTAITRGFRLEASDLGDVIDVVNTLQNRFGANFGQTAQGVAAAAGAFGQAGGNYKELAALIATGSQITGLSGTNIATAIRRTADTAFRPERRQKIIDLLGIDPQDSSITELILRGMQEVTAHPEQAFDIAKALSTPELSSRAIVPLLRSQELFNQRLDATKDAAGSAEREMNKLARSPQQELEKLGNNLEQIGAAMAEIGAGRGVGVLLRGLNLGLDAVEKLTAALKIIPEPIREAGFAMAPLLAGLALARRFNLGGVLGAPASLTARSPRVLARTEILRGIDEQVAEERLATERFVRDAGRNTDNAAFARARLTRDDLSDKQRLTLTRQLDAYNERALDNAEAYEASRARLAQTEKTRVEFARTTSFLGGREDPNAAAQRLGIFYKSPIDQRPDSRGVPLVGQQLSFNDDIERKATAAASQAASRAAPAAAQAATRVATEAAIVAATRAPTSEPVAQRIAGFTGQTLPNTSRPVRDRIGDFTGRHINDAVDTIDEAIDDAVDDTTRDRGRQEAPRGRNRLGRLTEGLGAALAAAAPWLEVGVLGYLGISTVTDFLNRKAEETQKQIRDLRGQRTRASPDALEREARKVLESAPPAATARAIAEAQGAAERQPFLNPAAARATTLPGVQQAAAENVAAASRIRRLNAIGQGFTREEIRDRFNENIRAAAGDPKQIDAAVEAAIQEVRHGRGATFKPGKKTDQIIKVFIEEMLNKGRELKTVSGNLDDALASIDDIASASDTVGFFQASISLRGFKPGKDVKTAGRLRAQIVGLLQQTTDPKEFVQGVQSLQQIDQIVQQGLQERLTASLAAATTPAERGVARRQYVRGLRAERVAPIRADIADERTGIDQLQTRDITPAQEGRAAQLSRVLAPALAAIAARRKKIKTLSQQAKAEDRIIDLIDKAMQRDQFSDEMSAFDARTARLQAEAPNDRAAGRVLANRLQQKLAITRRKLAQGLATQEDVDNAVAAFLQAQKALSGDALQRLQAVLGRDSARARAGGESEQGQLQRAVSDATKIAAKTGRQKGFNSVDYIQAQQAIFDAQASLADFLDNQAEAMVQANAQLRLSQTEDPIKQAAIRVDEAADLFKLADTPEERITRRADLNNAKRDQRQTKQQEKFDSIEFNAQMEKITSDVEYAELQSLLKRIHGNRELRRAIKLRMKAIKDEAEGSSGFDVDLGSVRIPSPYEVTRVMRESRRQARANDRSVMQISNTPTIGQLQINVGKGESGEFFRQLDEFLGTTAGGQLMASGDIGL